MAFGALFVTLLVEHEAFHGKRQAQFLSHLLQSLGHDRTVGFHEMGLAHSRTMSMRHDKKCAVFDISSLKGRIRLETGIGIQNYRLRGEIQ